MHITTYKIHLKVLRSFSIGFTILSPKLNGLCFEIHIGIITLCIWGRGKEWFGFDSYWSYE